MQIRALAGEEGSEGQRGAAEEVVEPEAEIDSSQLSGNAGEEAVGGACPREVEAKGAGEVAIDGLDNLAPAPMLAAGLGTRGSSRLRGGEDGRPVVLGPMGVPVRASEALIGQIGSGTRCPGSRLRPTWPGRAHIRRPISARGAEQVLLLERACMGGRAPAQQGIGQPAVPPHPIAASSANNRCRHPWQRRAKGTATVSMTS